MKYFTLQHMKMEPIEGSETSEIINQTPGNYPKGNLLYSVHGESLKSRIFSFCISCLGVLLTCTSCLAQPDVASGTLLK